MDAFKAYRIHSEDGAISARLETIGVDDLSPGEVVVRTAWSGVNYKDALAATGAGKILRSFPLVGGIDVAGTVVSSEDNRYKEGDEVLVTSAGLGETRDGGYAEYARLQAESVIPLPSGLSLKEAMTIGTAGFSAALAVHRMEQNGQHPDQGAVAVNGATGGVGSIAVDMLARLGYSVTAITGKPEAEDYLRELGAVDVLTLKDIEQGTRPLEKAIWAGAVDNLGGDILGWFTRTMQYGGNIASIGLAQGIKLETTVMPFILRGVNLLGINSVDTPRSVRLEVWKRIASDLKPQHMDRIVTQELGLEGLEGCFQAYLDAKITGRTLVNLSGD
ncbi:MAG: oxidoreductase [Gammaproteobacteria bacterium]